MHVVIAGAHGRIARRLGRLLSERGDTATGLIRNAGHAADLAPAVRPVRCDLEATDTNALAIHLAGADAVVFAAGAGPGSGAHRKQTVDRDGAILLADAAELARVRRYLMVSALGAKNAPPGADVFSVYLRAKRDADADLRSRDLDWVVLRPGMLTDGAATGRVRLAADIGGGSVPRDDVAAVLMELLAEPAVRRVTMDLVSGAVPVGDAVRAWRPGTVPS